MARAGLSFSRVIPRDPEPAGLWRLHADPLLRNGLALVSNAALSALLGLAYWILAARLYPSHVLGVNAVMISSMITIANLAQLNLGNFLSRVLAGTGPQAGRIIYISYLVAAGSGAAFGLAFGLSSPWLAPELSEAFSSPWAVLGYAFCILAWTIFNLQDSVLSGLRQSVWVPVENGVHSLAKLLLLAAFVGTGWASLGPFLAWILPTFLLIPAVNLLVSTRFLPALANSVASQRIEAKEIAGMMGWDYLATIVMMVGLGTAPILVLQAAGPSAAAGYSIAWAITYSIYLIARSFGISMMAEAAADPALRRLLAARSLVSVAGLLLLAAGSVVVLAPYLLLIFGKTYAGENVALLRLLVLSAIPWGLSTIYVSLARSAGKTGRIAAIQVATVGLFFLIAIPLLPAQGVIGIGLAWLASHTFVFLAIGIVESFSNTSRATDFALLSVSCVGRLKQRLRPSKRELTLLEVGPAEADAAALILGHPPKNLIACQIATFENDCQTFKIGTARGASLYLKRATTQNGRASLSHHVSTVQRLCADIGHLPEAGMLPRILADVEDTACRFVIHEAVPGVNARTFLNGRPDRRELLGQSCAVMAAFHAANAQQTTITPEWLRQWVDEPLDAIASLPRHLSAKRTHRALQATRESQYCYWSGRRVSLGWHHGDFSPGNLFFDNRNEAGQGVRLSGVIDWDGACDNGPAGLDAWHLALTSESERRGTELGQTVVQVLLGEGPRFAFRPDEDLSTSHEPWRILVVLAWLRHLHGNLNKSERYGKNLVWRLGNIDRVLDILPGHGI